MDWNVWIYPCSKFCLQAICYFWQVIWRPACSRCEIKRRHSKSHSWFLWGQIRIAFLIVVSALERNQAPMPLHSHKAILHPTSTQRWGRGDRMTQIMTRQIFGRPVQHIFSCWTPDSKGWTQLIWIKKHCNRIPFPSQPTQLIAAQILYARIFTKCPYLFTANIQL